MSTVLAALDTLNSHAAASPLLKRFKPVIYHDETRAVNWQVNGYTETTLDGFCEKWTISEVGGKPIVDCASDGKKKWDLPVTYYITQVKDIRPEGCAAGWTLQVLGEGNKPSGSWVSLLPMCKDWSTEQHRENAPETTVVGEKEETLFRHPECLGWDVEEVSRRIFRPKCQKWKSHVGGEYDYRHIVVYEEVAQTGSKCMDWRVDVDTRKTGRLHDQTTAMPFCNDLGSINSVSVKEGKSDTAFSILSEDAGRYGQPI